MFDFYDHNNIHALNKFLKYLSFDEFSFYYSLYFNKIRVEQI